MYSDTDITRLLEAARGLVKSAGLGNWLTGLGKDYGAAVGQIGNAPSTISKASPRDEFSTGFKAQANSAPTASTAMVSPGLYAAQSVRYGLKSDPMSGRNLIMSGINPAYGAYNTYRAARNWFTGKPDFDKNMDTLKGLPPTPGLQNPRTVNPFTSGRSLPSQTPRSTAMRDGKMPGGQLVGGAGSWMKPSARPLTDPARYNFGASGM